MFDNLEKINSRPEPFEFYTAEELWTNAHTSKKMLEYHLNNTVDLASRNKDFIHRSVKWISDYFKVDSNTCIADFGCGPGLYTTLFAENHAKVTGIDFSKTSIEYAKNIAAQKGLDICYINKNYLEFETEKKFDLITMIFCDYCALSPAQREILLKKFHSFLKPGGSLFLDVHSINRFNEIKECAIYEINQLNGFWSPEKYYGFLNTFRYEQEKVSLDKYTIIEQSETRVVYNWLQYFTKDSLQKELEKSGFEVKEFFSDVTGSEFKSNAPDMAVYAKRP